MKSSSILIVVVCTLFVVSCEDQWRNYAKDSFAGKWQLRETVDAENTRFSIDTIFYNFDKGVLKLQALSLSGKMRDARFGMYTFTNDSLFLEMKKPYTNMDYLRGYYGWTSTKKRFKIVKESHTKFVLSDAEKTYYFRKF